MVTWPQIETLTICPVWLWALLFCLCPNNLLLKWARQDKFSCLFAGFMCGSSRILSRRIFFELWSSLLPNIGHYSNFDLTRAVFLLKILDWTDTIFFSNIGSKLSFKTATKISVSQSVGDERKWCRPEIGNVSTEIGITTTFITMSIPNHNYHFFSSWQ